MSPGHRTGAEDPELRLSRTQVDRAGALLRNFILDEPEVRPAQAMLAYVTAEQYRSLHAYPLVLVTNGLRSFVTRESPGGFVAQRFKRMDRMINKLIRLPTHRLSQMEDIAGCRAVLQHADEVRGVRNRIRRNWDVVHEYPYDEEPKPSGYRARHIVVRRQDRLVEIQLRTTYQHTWAEEVERSSTVTGHNLKDGQGPADLLRYFELASLLLAKREAGDPPDDELRREFDELHEHVGRYYR